MSDVHRTWRGLLSVMMLVVPTTAYAVEDWKGASFGDPTTYAEFHGFADAQYYDFGKDGPAAGKSQFELGNFYLSIRAQVAEGVFLLGEMEFEHGGPSHGSPDNFFLDRLFIQRRFNPGFTLRVGKVFAPFGSDPFRSGLPAGSNGNPLTSPPLIFTQLRYEDWGDVGAEIYGAATVRPISITYDAAVVNGPKGLETDDRQNNDNNNNKTVVGRLGILSRMGDHRSLDVGVSSAAGKYDDLGQLALRLMGADAQLEWQDLTLRGEYIKRTGDDQPLPAVKAAANGFYLLAAYKLLHDPKEQYYVQPVIRYEASDIPSINDRFTKTTIGVDYSPTPHYLVKTEASVTKEDTTSLKNNGYMVSVVVDF
ncbi:MAG: hypothetical protein HY207_00775 [Nitrospirae bacterium]|nr:hypothetical protein [Nitrospirota bacterium]